ncbi:MAG: rhomboid family intramembrane serine protease [Prevotella sp.]|nr:rhomboid family intramembrane serine protease [Prevotella sp.]
MNNLPTVTRNLLIINVLVFIFTLVIPSATSYLGLHFVLADNFRIWQLLTYMFVHGGFTHIFFNMFALWMFGRVMENVWGPRKFLYYYLVCGIGAGIMQELAQLGTYYFEGLYAYEHVNTGTAIITTGEYLNLWNTVGASGAVYGILLAFGMTFPNERIFIFPIPVPIKAKWFVIGYAALELFSSVSSSMDGIAHLAHLGGMLFGLLLILYWRRHPGSDARFSRNRGQEFFNNMKRNFEQRKKPSQPQTPPHQTPREADMEYNARKQQRQAEVDAILDKIRKSGYDSLTKEEKKRLFEASKEG